MSEAGEHGGCQSGGQIVLQRHPDQVFRPETGEGVQEILVVGQMSEDRVEEESPHP